MLSKKRRGVLDLTTSQAAAVLLFGWLCFGLGTLLGAGRSRPRDPGPIGLEATERASFAAPHSRGGWGTPAKGAAGRGPASLSGGPHDRRFVSRASLPYQCGVVFFLHIPCSGGTSISKWLEKYKLLENGNVSQYSFWRQEVLQDGQFNPWGHFHEEHFAKQATKHIEGLRPNEWRVVHSHLLSTYLNESEDLLNRWRSTVEAKGCEMINAVMLRDPLNHAMALYKIVEFKNSTREEWTRYLESPTGPGKWATVLDFFLYNNFGLRYKDGYPNGPGGRNPFNVTKEEKVRRAMELLHRHFDVVSVGDYAAFADRLLNYTGWKRLPIGRTNTYGRGIHFTKREVETLQKLLRRNGDVDFVDQVNLEYQKHLSYMGVKTL